MKHTLLLGLGGTGGRVVNNVTKELKKNHIPINNGIVSCFVLDTNSNDMQKINDSHTDTEVISTSSGKLLSTIMKQQKNCDEWCITKSGGFRARSTSSGAAQMRIQSRLAFLDAYSGNMLDKLKHEIDHMLTVKDHNNETFNVTIVSSISGGTGAGIFIQTALWLRKYFKSKGHEINSLKAILLMPDIFTNNVSNIKNVADLKNRHYANAYAAMREMNAIKKVRINKSVVSAPMKIDDLFDSETWDVLCKNGEVSEKDLFDFVFLIDDSTFAGASFNTVDDYQDLVAQLVYMQLYTPLDSNMASEEDNLFIKHASESEPLFGSCGTSKLTYPIDNVFKYCVLKASRNAITGGWNKIDDTIEKLKKKEQDMIDDGVTITDPLDPVEKYIELFENKINSHGKGKADMFFKTFKNDIEILPVGAAEKDDKVDKVDDFIANIQTRIADAVSELNKDDNGFGKLNYLGISPDTYDGGDADDEQQNREDLENYYRIREEDTKKSDQLRQIVKDNKDAIEPILAAFDTKQAKSCADKILEEIFTCDMEAVNMKDRESVYGLLAKTENGKSKFVHPISARYLLYKLLKKTKELKSNINLSNARSDIFDGIVDGGNPVSFDYTRTRRIDEQLDTYFDTVPAWFTGNENDYALHFINKYREHMRNIWMAARLYEINTIEHTIFNEIENRLNTLIDNISGFFTKLPSVIKSFDAELNDNITEYSNTSSVRVHYVCADEKSKEYLFNSLPLKDDDGDDNVNESVIKSAYGMMCAAESPTYDANKEYAECDIADNFEKNLIASYKEKIKTNCKKEIDLDIFQAFKAELAANGGAMKEAVADEPTEIVWNEVDEKPEVKAEVVKEFAEVLKTVEKKSDFWLHYTNNTAEELPIFTFWGYNTCLTDVMKAHGTDGTVGLSASDEYPKNEICCYKSLYAVTPKMLNKLVNGDYYNAYKKLIDNMVEEYSKVDHENGGINAETPLLQTPHLDKRWHETLPEIFED